MFYIFAETNTQNYIIMKYYTLSLESKLNLLRSVDKYEVFTFELKNLDDLSFFNFLNDLSFFKSI